MERQGEFTSAGEYERIQELQILIENLQIRTHLFADSKSNFFPVSAYLPKERDFVVSQLQFMIDSTEENQMEQYRNSLTSLE